MKSITDAVLPIIRETRGMLMPHWGKAATEKKENMPGAWQIVTEVDRAVEKFLAEKLKALDPSITFAGEEFGGARTDERFWLCDPIDGTGHYVRGLPCCSVMLALIEKGVVTFSVVYDFLNDAIYHAERGEGAYKNGESIHVSQRPIEEAYMSYESHIEKQENMDTFMKLRGKGVFIKTISAGWEFAMVASGKLEARIQFDPYGYDYDFAPGSLLVEEAGGVVANLGSRTYDFRNRDFIAANPVVFKELTEGSEALFPIT
jgi:myo-inositol-1(or 4)-monophosphatase